MHFLFSPLHCLCMCVLVSFPRVVTPSYMLVMVRPVAHLYLFTLFFIAFGSPLKDHALVQQHIGNAIPAKMAYAVVSALVRHLRPVLKSSIQDSSTSAPTPTPTSTPTPTLSACTAPLPSPTPSLGPPTDNGRSPPACPSSSSDS